MAIHTLWVAHIAVLGYWLGSELVINSTYRYVSFSAAMPFPERDRLMEHVMKVDQHVRYALVLQASLGLSLAACYGFVPGGAMSAWLAAILGVVWLGFVEVVHRLRHQAMGPRLAAVDHGVRYVLMAMLGLIALGVVGGDWRLPGWLRVKLGLFAAVMACGVGIRWALISHFRTWRRMALEGPTDETNGIIRRTYFRATGILALLWCFITLMVGLSLWKPIA